MSIQEEPERRSESKCELCGATNKLNVYKVEPVKTGNADENILICETCSEQLENPDKTDANHWRCLNDSMWSQVPAVQVMAWRILKRLKAEAWARDLLDMLYLDEETLTWAKATGDDEDPKKKAKHVDSNGNELNDGDTVTLIKNLDVKGANFTAKRGTAVRRISLVKDNPEHIEGKVEGQQIVILTKFVKKTS